MSKTKKTNENELEGLKQDSQNENKQTECPPETQQPVSDEKADQLEQLNDRYLRLCAEYDNFKKRTQKEKADIYTDVVADVMTEVLPVMDTIVRAIEMDGNNEGIQLIKKQLDTILEKIGIEQINPKGEQFNPQLHEAVMHIQDEKIDSNTIVEVFAAGYKYRDKIIRHSMVKVAN
ncbi:MAG: nucleotide exchange factor GrpE [Clostridiaceae bacterium]|jgi:molecular chaperone GrpE|nr:nucleotide exchange factor GrpE [Clostridiaceae bacterium]